VFETLEARAGAQEIVVIVVTMIKMSNVLFGIFLLVILSITHPIVMTR
jgi:hypothetical protein